MTLDPGSALPARPSPGAAGACLGEMYSGNARMVYGLCRMLLDDPTEAEDATQQVFLSAYRSLLTGTEVEKPSAWLGTIARNECRARSTARARNVVAFNDAVTLVSPGADEQAAGRADAAELYSEVAALPDKQRAAVVLRDIYGLRYDEVASALGTSRPAVEALLFRGRRRLQRRLRPGLAAGVLVVPLSLHESLAYAVPGFATAAGPAGVAAGVVAMPLLAKVAAVGAAATLAGSTGVIAERYVHDSPARPVDATMTSSGTPQASPARSLVSAGTPLLDARVAETTHEGQSADRENGKDDSETEQSDGVHNDTKEQHTDTTERRSDTSKHESSNETTHTTEQAVVSDVSIDQNAPDGSGGSHQGSDGHEPDASRDSTGDSGAASDDG